MLVWTLLSLSALVWLGNANEDEWFKGKIDEDGYLFINPPGQVMSPFRPNAMVSPNYPEPAQNKMKRKWRFVSGSDDKSAFKVICHDFRLPKSSCEDHSLTIEDGDKTHVYCGNSGPINLLTFTDDITALLKNGPEGETYMNCTVEAILIGPKREPLPTPKPVLPTYLTDESEEVNSEEHGGPEGPISTTCPCGWANKQGFSRIVNGSDTAPNEFPFAAALVEKDSLWQFCGATIITAWHALTATHCTIGWRERPRMALIVGEHDLNDDANAGPSQVIDVVNIVDHQGYVPKKFVDDISLLILGKEIVFSAKVGPACLPSHQYDLTKQYIKIIGWGAIHWRGPGSAILQKVDVRVVDREECHRIYSGIVKKDNPTHLCTYSRRKASCQGDSGGPVVWVDPETNRYTLVGIVSFGRVCADSSPSVHTDVGAYIDWVQHFVSASKPTAQICYKKE